MKTYALAYVSLFDNVIEMCWVNAPDYRSAIIEGLVKLAKFERSDAISYIGVTTDEDLGAMFFDGDFQIEALVYPEEE